MKKISLVLTALALGTMSFAQVQFGLKGGLNLAELDDEVAPNQTEMRTAYHFGALAHIHINNRFAIQPEVVYSAQGTKYTIPNYRGVQKLSYVNVPVLAQFMLGTGFRIQTGPQVGVLVNAKFEPEGSNLEVSNDDSYDNADFAWTFGVSYVLPVNLGIDARYNLGLNNIQKNLNTDIKNRVWQFGLFYQFPRRLGRPVSNGNTGSR